MKKILSIILIIAMAFTFMTGCGENEKIGTEKIKIVTTIYPQYDWIMNVLGDEAKNFDIELLMADGVDLHSYQPSVEDIVKISSCDLFIFVGGESDAWVKDALAEAKNEDMIVLNMMDIVSEYVKEEEIIEGMQLESDELKDMESNDFAFDEHVWLSLRNAERIVGVFGNAISILDPDNDDVYRENTAEYIKQLNSLDKQFIDVTTNAKKNTIVVGDRFPFRYLVDDYAVKYFAAFSGCSADSEASFETIAFLADKIDELELNAIITTESDIFGIAKTVADSAKRNVEILSMNSMQSVTLNDVQNGISYLSMMEDNLETLKKALN